jgi:hypothetical protein
MNNDKAYLMGLIVGGGRLRHRFTEFDIQLPYRKWGSVMENPERAGQIATDIMTFISPIFEYEYNLRLSYEPGGRNWLIQFYGDLEPLRNDLNRYGLLVSGNFRDSANIETLRTFLRDANLKRHFIAGLADTIGSLARTHRRFTDGYQIVSFEFSGFNYRLVQQVCQMLHEIGCYPDQVLWNHPNQHSTHNAYYSAWKKGFKIRVLLDQYTQAGSFFSQAKMEGALENLRLSEGEEHLGAPCRQKPLRVTPTALHRDEGWHELPLEIRDGHYIHSKHFCVVLGCPFAPVEQVRTILGRANNYINPFTLLTKGRVEQIEQMRAADEIMANRVYTRQSFSYRVLRRCYLEDPDGLLWGTSSDNGYPINLIMEAIGYVTAAEAGRVSGTRVQGRLMDWLDSTDAQARLEHVEILMPDLLSPLIVRNTAFAALVGPHDPEAYRSLISVDESLKLRIRDIAEGDLE